MYNCPTCFSLRYGVMPVDQLLEEAEEKGLSCIALIDIDNTPAPLEFVMKAQEKGIRARGSGFASGGGKA